MTLIRVKASNLAAGSVLEAALGTGSVTTPKLGNAAVTDDKMAASEINRYFARQTVQQGPEDAKGIGNWIVPTAVSSLVVKTQYISELNPLVVSASMGFGSGYGYGSERIGLCEVNGDETGNLRWTLAANSGVNYLYVDIGPTGAMTTGQTTVAPVYSRTASSGINTFNFGKMVMFTSGITKGFRVFVGEANAGATGYSGAFAYTHGGVFYGRSDPRETGSNALFTQNHNLGIAPRHVSLFLECIAAGDSNYNVGDIVQAPTQAMYSHLGNFAPVSDRLKSDFWVYDWYLPNNNTHSFFAITDARWKWWLVCERGW